MKYSLSRFLVFPLARSPVFPSSRFLVLLVAATLLITTTAHAQVVEIPDPNLEGTIRETLNLPDNQPVTQQEMLQLTELLAWQRDITDLTGLEHATNLENLHLWGNQITDLSPLANLTKLRDLDLAYNAVVSVEPIAELINLQRLNLTLNRVQDITPLANLIHLERLYIRENLVTDITPLANLTNLTELTLSQNQVRDLNPLAGLTRLTVLHLSDNRISDLTPLMNLTALETLRLNMNAIVDITPLIGLKNLKRLQLAENSIRDFTPLSQLEGIELDLNIDLSRLDQLNLVVEVPDPNLRQAIREALSLPDGVRLTQLEMLRLTELFPWQRDIINLTGLQYATNLENLHLWGNQITDLSPLANLTKLRDLDLAYNAVVSLEPIAGLINLQRLNLTINHVQDITPLANLINLEFLYIRDNLVTDITPIQGLNLIEFQYDEICDIPPIAPPVRERIQNRNFPSIFAWGGSHKTLGLDHLTPDQRAALHDFDLGVWYNVNWDQTPTEPYEKITTSLAGDLSRSRETHRTHLDLNPNLISLLTVNHITHLNDEAFPPDTDFWVRDANGEIARRPSGSPIINFLKPEVQDLIAKRIIAVERCGLYDGVHLDQWGDGINLRFDDKPYFPVPDEEILQARRNILRAVREQVREDFLIVVNGGLKKIPHYADYINGSFMETGRDTPFGYSHNELKKIESTLLWSEKNLREPQTNCLEGTGIPTEPPDGPTNRRMMRVHTTLSLTHSDGYVMYTTGEGSVIICPECPYPWGPGHRHIWHPFWDADLGYPVGPKAQQYQNIEGLFIREFTNGWAVYNRSGNAQTITLPRSATPVSDRGNNAVSQTHRLPDLDGEMYLKAKNPADVNGDGKINILDLVQTANGFGKSTPDPNGDGVVNILDLTLVAQQLE